MTKWIKPREMKTTDGHPVPVGEVVLFTSSELHDFGDGYTGVGRLVKASQDNDVVVEFLRFRKALKNTYHSRVMDEVRRQDYRELEERRMAHTLKDYDHDPSKDVWIYHKSRGDDMRLWKHMWDVVGRDNTYAIEVIAAIPEGHVFIEAQAPTYVNGPLFADGLEAALKDAP